RQRVLDAVFEHAGVRACGLDGVRVHPAGEGAGDLLVAKHATRLEGCVFGNPPLAERPDFYFEIGAGAWLGRRSGPGERVHGLPGRREALEGAGAREPGEEIRSGRRDAGTLDEFVGFHRRISLRVVPGSECSATGYPICSIVSLLPESRRARNSESARCEFFDLRDLILSSAANPRNFSTARLIFVLFAGQFGSLEPSLPD